jgi:hypothetical protein
MLFGKGVNKSRKNKSGIIVLTALTDFFTRIISGLVFIDSCQLLGEFSGVPGSPFRS